MNTIVSCAETSMKTQRIKPFTLADGMTVIAGMAVGLWARPEGLEQAIPVLIGRILDKPSLYSIMQWGRNVLILSQPIVAFGTLTTLVLGYRHRCPPFRRLASQPGFVACSSAVLTMMIVGPQRFVSGEWSLVPGLSASVWASANLSRALTFRGGECGIAVAAAWMVLVLGGRWRPRRDLIEWGGQVFGWFWIVMIPLNLLGSILR